MFDFNRRINRRTYLLGWILAWAAWLPVFLVADIFYGPGGEDNPSLLSLGILAVFFLIFFSYTLCLTKQRSNDVTNEHAVLLAVVLYVTWLAFVLLFWPGEKQANSYGSIPKGIALRR